VFTRRTGAGILSVQAQAFSRRFGAKKPGLSPGLLRIKKPRAVSLQKGEGNRLRSPGLFHPSQADRGFLPVIHHHRFKPLFWTDRIAISGIFMHKESPAVKPP
jgi:hypothetical protein